MSMLTGFKRPQNGRRGGVRQLWLIRAADVSQVACSDDGLVADSIEMREGTALAGYEFAEDTAFYKEEVVVSGGAAKVVHQLTFSLPCLDEASAEAFSQLAAQEDGVVALIGTMNGEVLLVGYSRKLGLERPLKLGSCSSATGKSVADVPQRVLTMKCESTAPAMRYGGSLPNR